MKISIVIIVKNDRSVDKTLASLSDLSSSKNIEIIVVDGSADRLNDIKAKYTQILWHHFTSTSKKKISIAEQRNVGVSLSSGEVIVFIDSSCVPTTGWLDLLIDRYHSGELIVAGPVIPSDPKVVNNISARLSETSSYIMECPTANVLIAKEVFDSVGRFDERFDYGSDTDFMWRARKKGFKILFEPKAVVTHDWGTYSQQLKRAYNYGRGRMRLYLKHKLSIMHMISFDPILFFYPIYILLLPIAIVFPFYLLLLVIPIVKNIKNQPFHVLLQNMIYGFGGLLFLVRNLSRLDRLS